MQNIERPGAPKKWTLWGSNPGPTGYSSVLRQTASLSSHAFGVEPVELEKINSVSTGNFSQYTCFTKKEWTLWGSNPGPTGYEPVALTCWAKRPKILVKVVAKEQLWQVYHTVLNWLLWPLRWTSQPSTAEHSEEHPNNIRTLSFANKPRMSEKDIPESIRIGQSKYGHAIPRRWRFMWAGSTMQHHKNQSSHSSA